MTTKQKIKVMKAYTKGKQIEYKVNLSYPNCWDIVGNPLWSWNSHTYRIAKQVPWRLPTVKELLTLVDYTKHNPACGLKDTKNQDYWSSTEYSDAKDWILGISFVIGLTKAFHRTNYYYVRAVREVEGKLEWSKSSVEAMTHSEAKKYVDTLTNKDKYIE